MSEEPSQITRDVGSRIKSIRRQSGLSQAQLSERAGLSRSCLSRIEAGHPGSQTACHLLALALAMGVDGGALLEGLGGTTRPPHPLSLLLDSAQVGDHWVYLMRVAERPGEPSYEVTTEDPSGYVVVLGGATDRESARQLYDLETACGQA